MERTGQVVAVHGAYLEVACCRPSECESCHACGGVDKEIKLKVKGKGKVGDLALVELPEKGSFRASALAYAMPLGLMLLGLFAGALLFPAHQDLAACIGAVIGLAAAMIVLKVTEKSRAEDPKWQPQLIRIVSTTKGE